MVERYFVALMVVHFAQIELVLEGHRSPEVVVVGIDVDEDLMVDYDMIFERIFVDNIFSFVLHIVVFLAYSVQMNINLNRIPYMNP